MNTSLRSIFQKLRTRFTNRPQNVQDTSQGGEVAALRSLLRPDDPPYLVDVGAHDGQYLSNSWPFIQEGWRAILIEPLPSVYRRLVDNHRNNKRVICINKACSNATGNQPLYIGADGEMGTMSTLCTDDNEWFRQNRTSRSILVSVDTLTNILNQHNWPRDFSLLLIDAEGMDYEVLLGLDFNIYRPRIVVTEEYASNPEKHKKKYELLAEVGYTFHSAVAYNTIWTRNK